MCSSDLGNEAPAFVTVPVETETRDSIAAVWQDNVNAAPPQEIIDALANPCA